MDKNVVQIGELISKLSQFKWFKRCWQDSGIQKTYNYITNRNKNSVNEPFIWNQHRYFTIDTSEVIIINLLPRRTVSAGSRRTAHLDNLLRLQTKLFSDIGHARSHTCENRLTQTCSKYLTHKSRVERRVEKLQRLELTFGARFDSEKGKIYTLLADP